MGKEIQRPEGNGIEDVHESNEGDVEESHERQGGTAAGKVAGVDIQVAEFLRARSVTFREKGPHIEMDCPECGGRNHTQTRRKRNSLKVNPDLGTFHCIVCQRKGGFQDLRHILGDTRVLTTEDSVGGTEVLVPLFTPLRLHKRYRQLIFEKPGKKALDFLYGLGVSDHYIRRGRVGYNEEFDCLSFSYQYNRGSKSLSYLRMFKEPNDWWKASGDPATASFYLQHAFKPGNDVAVVAQTPLDALVLWAIGVENVLAPYGDNDDVRYRSHLVALLQRCPLVYVVPHPSPEGARWAATTVNQIGRWRCKVIELDTPAHQIGDLDKFKDAEKKAVGSLRAKTRRASSMLDIVDVEFTNRGQHSGFKIGLHPLEALLDAWRPGEVTVLSGPSGIGKSTLAAFLALLVGSDDIPTLHCSFEVLPKAIIKKWLCMLGTKGFAEMQAQDYSAARRKLARRPMYILDTYGMADLNDVRRCVYDAVTRHRVKYVVIDHVGFLRDSAADTEIASTSSVMRELKRWALDLQCHILVLAHLRKQKPGETKQAGIEDLRGSADLFQIADNVVLLNRSRGNSSMKARVLKCRDDSGKEGVAELSFNPATLRYSAT
jgi:hypothetical protein